MSVKIDVFPSMTKELIEKIGYSSEEYNFTYTEKFQNHELESVHEDSYFSISDCIKLIDKKCVWYPETHNLHIIKRCEINNANILFGSNGIVEDNAILGIALSWSSKEANQCDVIPFGTFQKTKEKYCFNLDYSFAKGSMKGNILLKIVLYLKEYNNVSEILIHTGTILGELERCKVLIDGKGSIFPIKEINKVGYPLWWVDYNAVDPMSDEFCEENVCIILNSAHPNYELLKIESSLKDSQILVEIISNALQIIIQLVKDNVGSEWNNLISGQGFDTGSIAEIVYFFINKFGWDTSNANSLSLSIRKFFDEKL